METILKNKYQSFSSRSPALNRANSFFKEEKESRVLGQLFYILNKELHYTVFIGELNAQQNKIIFNYLSLTEEQRSLIRKYVHVDPKGLALDLKNFNGYNRVINNKKSLMSTGETNANFLNTILKNLVFKNSNNLAKLINKNSSNALNYIFSVIPQFNMNCIDVPLVVDNKVIAIAAVIGEFKERDIFIIEHCVLLASMAIENIRLKNKLKISEENYGKLAENSLAGICIYYENRIVFSNAQLSQIFGYSKNELMRADMKRLLNPNGKMEANKLVNRICDNRETSGEFTLWVRRKNTKRILVKMRTSLIPHNNSSNAVLISMVDITTPKRSERRLQQLYHTIIKSLSGAVLKVKDSYTESHSQKVRVYAMMIAKALGLDEDKILEIEIAGYLHDIGKLEIKSEILQKKGSLTHSEYLQMMKHPKIGADRILSAISKLDIPRGIIKIIKHHHERYDGNKKGIHPGYPSGLNGFDIPLGSRILAVADAYDAMISNRPYRKALNRDEAIAELKRQRGKQFDPHIVDIFLKLIS